MQLLKHQINVLEEQKKIRPQILEKLDNLAAMNTRLESTNLELESNNLALQVKFEEQIIKADEQPEITANPKKTRRNRYKNE